MTTRTYMRVSSHVASQYGIRWDHLRQAWVFRGASWTADEGTQTAAYEESRDG